jgi:hypothetical protein
MKKDSSGKVPKVCSHHTMIGRRQNDGSKTSFKPLMDGKKRELIQSYKMSRGGIY